MNRRRPRPRPGARRSLRPLGRGAFTLVELMIYVVISGVVIGSVYQLLINQSRAYGKQRELIDVHETIRGAAALLAWEIRQTSAAGADLYATGANSITLRSTQGAGIVCALHGTLPRAGIASTWGDFAAAADDSALVFSVSGNMWLRASIPQVRRYACLIFLNPILY